MAIAACDSAPEVKVNGETLIGKSLPEFSVSAFLGVPFAQAPVGDLRWRGPQPYETAGAIRHATEFAPACLQTPRIVDWYRDLAELFGNSRSVVPDLPMSEDCLYLNIWTPEPDSSSPLPVMVYIHGGSNRSGWSWEPNYHGHALARQDVVVVSVAYRLGDFGFFAHPELDGDEAVANFALWDLIASLRWIQENIVLFGGDANQVTLFGESAGAANIISLMMSREADDLFSRAIMQSSGGFGYRDNRTLEDERARGMALAKSLGSVDRSLSIEELRNIPGDEFLELSENHRGDHYHNPVIDGALIAEPSLQTLASGRMPARPIMIGTNADEWYAYIDADADQQTVASRAEQMFPEDPEAALAAVSDEADLRVRTDRIHTAARMACPSQFLAVQVAGNYAPAWVYLFGRAREGRAGNEWRAYHGVELPYVFGTHDAWMTVSDADHRVTDTTMSYWLQFAKTGDPNSATTPEWPAFAAPDFPVQRIDDPARTIETPEPELCAMYFRGLQGE